MVEKWMELLTGGDDMDFTNGRYDTVAILKRDVTHRTFGDGVVTGVKVIPKFSPVILKKEELDRFGDGLYINVTVVMVDGNMIHYMSLVPDDFHLVCHNGNWT